MVGLEKTAMKHNTISRDNIENIVSAFECVQRVWAYACAVCMCVFKHVCVCTWGCVCVWAYACAVCLFLF